MEKYNVLIIGAGSIGALFDTPESNKVLTHAHAFTKHKGFNLLGFVDADVEKTRKALSLWGGIGFKNIEEAFDCGRVDVAVVAVPDEYHYAVLKKLSHFPLQVIFTEKPITRTLEEAKDIIRIFRERHIGVAVNYTRRYVPEFDKIRNDIQKGVYGDYLTGTGYYGKGIMHNGSHLIDLLRFFIGEIKATKPIDSVSDFYQDDKSVSAALTLENNRHFFLQSVDCRMYTMFEIDLLFERKRIKIVDLGFKIEEFDVLDSEVFKGYKNIVKTVEKGTSLEYSLFNAAENIYNNLTNGQDLKCTDEDGYKALRTCIEIKESIE